MKITGNEPANPMAAFRVEHLEGMSENGILIGLTIRQQFAMSAMQGLLANSDPEYKARVADAVFYADALIEELNKEKTQ